MAIISIITCGQILISMQGTGGSAVHRKCLTRGNCYGFACTFAALAKELGYDPYVICGRVPGSRDQAADGYTRHGWVLINGLHYDAEGAFAGWGGCFGTSSFTTAYQVQKIVRFKY